MFSKQHYLQMAAKRIEDNPEEYDWYYSSQCNCGILAQCVLGVDEDELLRLIAEGWHLRGDGHGIWGRLTTSPVCPQTGISRHRVIAALQCIGFSLSEIADIEFLGEYELVSHKNKFENPQNVVVYLRGLADSLDQAEQSASMPAQDIPEITSHPVEREVELAV